MLYYLVSLHSPFPKYLVFSLPCPFLFLFFLFKLILMLSSSRSRKYKVSERFLKTPRSFSLSLQAGAKNLIVCIIYTAGQNKTLQREQSLKTKNGMSEISQQKSKIYSSLGTIYIGISAKGTAVCCHLWLLPMMLWTGYQKEQLQFKNKSYSWDRQGNEGSFLLWSMVSKAATVPETWASASANDGCSSLWMFCFVISPKELLSSTPAEKNPSLILCNRLKQSLTRVVCHRKHHLYFLTQNLKPWGITGWQGHWNDPHYSVVVSGSLSQPSGWKRLYAKEFVIWISATLCLLPLMPGLTSLYIVVYLSGGLITFFPLSKLLL